MCSRHPFLFGRIARGIFLGLVVLTAAGARSNDSIVVSATATNDYVRPLDVGGRPVAETYVFMEGEHMGGGAKDGSEGRMSFEAMTRVLAENLLKQNYIPTRNVPEARLLIRVFWGTTLIYEDPQKQLNVEALNSALSQYSANVEANGIADSGEINSVLSRQATQGNAANDAIARNARLLGYQRTLDKLGTRIIATTDEEALRGELSEERYFVVLLAYDYEHLRRTKQARLLWITRLSIRSPGNNFTEALPLLALAGAESYGRNVDDLQRVKVRSLPGGEVNMPEMKVLGTEGERK